MRGLERRIVGALRHQWAALLAEVPGIREGDADAIHDARVATRRLRAILPVACGSSSGGNNADQADADDGLSRKIRKLAHALGAARDLDVALDELTVAERKLSPPAARDPSPSAERRLSPTADGASSADSGSSANNESSADSASSADSVSSGDSATAALYRQLRAQREASRRHLIKTIEQFPLEPASITRGCVRDRKYARRRLRTGVGERAHRLAAAVEHASGVYFPNRLHRVRIEVKKLRYAIELARTTGTLSTRNADTLLQDLRGAQDTLGTLHDRELLLAHLPVDGAASETASLRQLVEAERDDLFHEYLSRRADLAAVVDAATAFATPRRWHPVLWRVAIIAGAATAARLTAALMRPRTRLRVVRPMTQSFTAKRRQP